MLLGNKSDLQEQRDVSVEDAEKLANDLGCKYFEGSAKTGENIVEAMDEVTKISYQCYKETEKRNSIRISSQSHNSDKEKKKKKCC